MNEEHVEKINRKIEKRKAKIRKLIEKQTVDKKESRTRVLHKLNSGLFTMKKASEAIERDTILLSNHAFERFWERVEHGLTRSEVEDMLITEDLIRRVKNFGDGKNLINGIVVVVKQYAIITVYKNIGEPKLIKFIREE